MFPLPQQDYTVMVVTLTYNHAPYIEDTLKGILMQQTDFPIVACVLDDCSTDGTADIVRKYEAQYPDIIKGFYFEENQFSQGKFTFEVLIPWLSKVKYIALCEGDDFWTDPLKLQKQVDFMEAHPDCTMCFHSVNEHWEDGSAPDKIFFPVENRIYTGTEIFKQWVVATSSVMIRSNIFHSQQIMDIFNNKGLMYYDHAIYMYCSVVGKAMGMSDVMGVYRRLKTGYSIILDKNLKQCFDVIDRYCTHLQTMENIFGQGLGSEFQNIVQSRFVSKALDGCLLSIRHKQLRQAKHFLCMSYKRAHKETIVSFVKKLARLVVK